MPSIPYCRAKRQSSLYSINTNSLQLYKMIADIDPDGVPGEAATLLAALQPELRREEQIDCGSAKRQPRWMKFTLARNMSPENLAVLE